MWFLLRKSAPKLQDQEIVPKTISTILQTWKSLNRSILLASSFQQVAPMQMLISSQTINSWSARGLSLGRVAVRLAQLAACKLWQIRGSTREEISREKWPTRISDLSKMGSNLVLMDPLQGSSKMQEITTILEGIILGRTPLHKAWETCRLWEMLAVGSTHSSHRTTPQI